MFAPKPGKLKGRKRWIAFFHHPKGTLVVDDGARQALRENGRSLLRPGIRECLGDFAEGDVVSVCDTNRMEFARGIARAGAATILANPAAKDVILHRDDLVIL